MSRKLSRRGLLKIAALSAGGLGIILARSLGKPWMNGMAQRLQSETYLPFISKTDPTSPTPESTPSSTEPPPSPEPTEKPPHPPSSNRVVHVRSENATNWTGGDPFYWNYVDQKTIDNMVDRGVMELTGASTLSDAWYALLPNYNQGQGIAIKANLVNSRCAVLEGKINALIQPINAIIRGLKEIGVDEADIWIYDAFEHSIPEYFLNDVKYKGVKFFDGGCYNEAGFSNDNPNAEVHYKTPPGTPSIPKSRLTDILVHATYLINMPTIKYHSGAHASLAFKNHLGSITNPFDTHNNVFSSSRYYDPAYNPLVDIYLNSNISKKTVFTLGDGIFGNWEDHRGPPSPWSTFGDDYPKSLFFSLDPVAIDSVMCDYIHAERSVSEDVNDYLKLASSKGLGTFERGDPWGGGYNLIDYRKIEL